MFKINDAYKIYEISEKQMIIPAYHVIIHQNKLKTNKIYKYFIFVYNKI